MKTNYGLQLVAFGIAAGVWLPGWAAPPNAAPPDTATRAAAPAGENPLSQRRTGETRYDWAWVAKRYDKNADGVVTREELGASAEIFHRLDRTWDGRITADDLNWSLGSRLDQQKEAAFPLFRTLDANSDGRITPEEWRTAFERSAGEKGALTDEDLERFVFLPRAQAAQRRKEAQATRPTEHQDDPNRGHGGPKLGELAPDFDLKTPDGSARVRLSSFRKQKPVALIFGSYTCGPFRTQSGSLEAMSRRWKDQVEFITVYVREAHPVDGWRTPANDRAGILIKQPVTFAERCSVASRSRDALQLESTLVVDEIDNRVGEAYDAWPDRLYIVDVEGNIVYRGGPGPFAFNTGEMEQSLLFLLLDQGMDGSNDYPLPMAD